MNNGQRGARPAPAPPRQRGSATQRKRPCAAGAAGGAGCGAEGACSRVHPAHTPCGAVRVHCMRCIAFGWVAVDEGVHLFNVPLAASSDVPSPGE